MSIFSGEPGIPTELEEQDEALGFTAQTAYLSPYEALANYVPEFTLDSESSDDVRYLGVGTAKAVENVEIDSTGSSDECRSIVPPALPTNVTTIATKPNRSVRLYPNLEQPTADLVPTVKRGNKTKRGKSADSSTNQQLGLTASHYHSDDEASDRTCRASKKIQITKQAFIAKEKVTEAIKEEIRKIPLPEKGDDKAKVIHDARIQDLQTQLDNSNREKDILKDNLLRAEQEKLQLWTQQQTNSVNQANLALSDAHETTRKLWNELQLNEHQKLELQNNFTVFQHTLKHQFDLQWEAADAEARKERSQYEITLSERESFIDQIRTDNIRLETKLSLNSSALDDCSIEQKKLAQTTQELNLEISRLQTLSFTKDEEIIALKKTNLEQTATLGKGALQEDKWKIHCNKLETDKKALEEQLTKGVADCTDHAAIIAKKQDDLHQVNTELSRLYLRIDNLEGLLSTAKASQQYSSEQYGHKVKQIDELESKLYTEAELNKEYVRENSYLKGTIGSLRQSHSELENQRATDKSRIKVLKQYIRNQPEATASPLLAQHFSSAAGMSQPEGAPSGVPNLSSATGIIKEPKFVVPHPTEEQMKQFFTRENLERLNREALRGWDSDLQYHIPGAVNAINPITGEVIHTPRDEMDMDNISQQQEPHEIANIFADHFAQLSVKDEKLQISPFYGNSQDTSVKEWLQECLMYASIHKWKIENYKEIFGSRLRGDAISWHAHRMRNFPNESYADWCKELKLKFQTPMDTERSKMRFYELQQKPNQQVQHFIDKLERTFESIYKSPRNLAFRDPERVAHKEDTLLRVFMKGLLPAIKDVMLNSNMFDSYTWPKVSKAAVSAENMIIARRLANPASINKISFETQELFDTLLKKNEDLEKKLTSFFCSQGAEGSGPAANKANQNFQRGGRGNFRGKGRDHHFNNNSNRNPNYTGRKRERHNSENEAGGQVNTEVPTEVPTVQPANNQHPQPNNQQKTIPECFHCKKRGHLMKNCWGLHGRPQASSPQ